MTISAYFVHDETPRLCANRSTTAIADGCELQYLNEGGANFVFRILPAEGRELPALLQRKLLRLRKDLPTVPCAEDQLLALDANFRDLFPTKNLVQHELIHIDEALPEALNESLQAMKRPGHRAADFLPLGCMSGLLVTDMTPKYGDILLQLKPKWLTQSPSAPADSRRCRTCAMRAHRASKDIRTATDAQENCPLDLLNPNPKERARAVRVITKDERLHEFLQHQAQPLLHKLREAQIAFDSAGILEVSRPEDIKNLCKAMTLRDCTLFVRRSSDNIEARLGDLDLKQPEKLDKWKRAESSLIDDGWYANTEDSSHWSAEKVCQLSRH